jgi:hypothetical protein
MKRTCTHTHKRHNRYTVLQTQTNLPVKILAMLLKCGSAAPQSLYRSPSFTFSWKYSFSSSSSFLSGVTATVSPSSSSFTSITPLDLFPDPFDPWSKEPGLRFLPSPPMVLGLLYVWYHSVSSVWVRVHTRPPITPVQWPSPVSRQLAGKMGRDDRGLGYMV